METLILLDLIERSHFTALTVDQIILTGKNGVRVEKIWVTPKRDFGYFVRQRRIPRS